MPRKTRTDWRCSPWEKGLMSKEYLTKLNNDANDDRMMARRYFSQAAWLPSAQARSAQETRFCEAIAKCSREWLRIQWLQLVAAAVAVVGQHQLATFFSAHPLFTHDSLTTSCLLQTSPQQVFFCRDPEPISLSLSFSLFLSRSHTHTHTHKISLLLPNFSFSSFSAFSDTFFSPFHSPQYIV
jgi:hypothetical protein